MEKDILSVGQKHTRLKAYFVITDGKEAIQDYYHQRTQEPTGRDSLTKDGTI